MYVILLGAPGAGKGTQAHTLVEKLHLAHVASGDLFREALKQGTELGLLAKSYMDRGALVPDEVTIAMIKERLAKPDCDKGVILDGFPRTIEQAKALDDALKGMDKRIDKVLYIKVSNEELIRRLSGRWICRNCQASFHEISRPPKVTGKCDECGGELYQRSDDTVETARKRLEVYFQQTAPLIDYYSQKGILVEVNGEQEIQLVERDLLADLK
ncbi:MAG: adenylate kinase [Chloroflexi bacterium]|nr:adenylate kinase [Chloroflexota bacterium]